MSNDNKTALSTDHSRADRAGDSQFTALRLAWDDLAKALSVGFREGWLDFERVPWQQDYGPVRDAWQRITRPENVEFLQQRIGTGGSSDGERMIQAAFHEAQRRAAQLLIQ